MKKKLLPVVFLALAFISTGCACGTGGMGGGMMGGDMGGGGFGGGGGGGG